MLRIISKSPGGILNVTKLIQQLIFLVWLLVLHACLLILQYVSFELSYENFQVNKDRIYRVQQDRYDNGKLSTQWAAGAYAVGNSFKDAIPEIEDYVKVVGNGRVTTDVNNQPLKIEKVYFASGSFFNIFTYPLIAGNKKTALKEPFTAALSETTAKKIFGTTNVVGKPLQLNRNSNYTITAVYKDAPVNTQLKPDMLTFLCNVYKMDTLIQVAMVLKLHGNGMAVLLIYYCIKVLILR